MCQSQALGFDVGPNGIAFNDGSLFVPNTHGATVVQVPVEGDGSAGTRALFAGPEYPNLEGADSLAVDTKGNLYRVSFITNKLVKVNKDGEVSLLHLGGLLNFPSSLFLGVGDDNKTLYIPNFAFLSAVADGQPKPGILLKEIGKKGSPLP